MSRSVVKVTPILKRNIFDILNILSILDVSETVLVTPNDAQKVINEFMPHYQRDVNREAVKKLSIEMLEGRFETTSVMFACYLNEGGEWVIENIDGKTRSHAIVDSGVSVRLHVCVNYYKNKEAARNAYGRLDRGRGRNFMDSVKANGVFDDITIYSDLKRRLHSVAINLDKSFPPGVSGNRNDANKFDKQQAKVIEYIDAIETYGEILRSGCNTGVKKMFAAYAVSSVAIATIHDAGEKAVVFWSRALANDGLRQGDPSKALLETLESMRDEGTGTQARARRTRMCELAWNASFKGEKMKLKNMKVENHISKINIMGTRFEIKK